MWTWELFLLSLTMKVLVSLNSAPLVLPSLWLLAGIILAENHRVYMLTSSILSHLQFEPLYFFLFYIKARHIFYAHKVILRIHKEIVTTLHPSPIFITSGCKYFCQFVHIGCRCFLCLQRPACQNWPSLLHSEKESKFPLWNCTSKGLAAQPSIVYLTWINS